MDWLDLLKDKFFFPQVYSNKHYEHSISITKPFYSDASVIWMYIPSPPKKSITFKAKLFHLNALSINFFLSVFIYY